MNNRPSAAIISAALTASLLLSGCGASDSDGPSKKAAASASEASAAEAAASSALAAESSSAAAAESSSAAAQQQEHDECQATVGGLLRTLKEINSRLNIGLDYQEYSDRLGDVQVEYDAMLDEFDEADCLNLVAIPLEKAFNEYIKVQGLWSDCIADYTCDFDEGEVDRKTQDAWSVAGRSIERAEENLDGLLPEPA